MIHSISLKEEPSSLTSQVKFIRRPDLTEEIRLKVAVLPLLFTVIGGVKGLSLKYKVSRTFIYESGKQVAGHLKGFFRTTSGILSGKQIAAKLVIRAIFMLRLEGKCSISAVSNMLKFQGTHVGSTGFISQTLKQAGACLPSFIEWQGKVVAACDEIFLAGHLPVIVTTDVVSGASLQVEILPALTKEAWANHLERLREKGIELIKIVSDAGTVMRSARLSIAQDIPWQTDTFHGLSYRLGIFRTRLERTAYKALEKEYERLAKLQSAKSPQMVQKRRQQWEQAAQDFLQAARKLDDFSFLYHTMLKQNTVFLPDGQARSRSFAEAEMQAAITCMRTLDIKGLAKELDEIEKNLSHFYGFLDGAAQATLDLGQKIESPMLSLWTNAWQYEKNAAKTKKNAAWRKYNESQSQTALDLLQEHYLMGKEDFSAFKQQVFSSLDQGCAQSSSSVETFNSFLRPYLNESRDQISQETLNLLMFFYNHRKFERGKRKGRAPIEILSGKPLEKDWLDLLMDKVEL